jgi:fermentation-respiration switch protein FrsA (DUF1100 family)
LPDFAKKFVASGYTVLLYDNRNWGESGGQPRNLVDPILQTRDYYDAFNFAITLPDVDAESVVYWGSSMSGGNAIMAAAMNKSIKGVISQVPFVSSAGMPAPPPDLCKTLVQDRAAVVNGTDPIMAPIFPCLNEVHGAGTQAILQDPNSIPFTEEMDRRGLLWEKYAAIQSLLHSVGHEPRVVIKLISPRPLLVLIAENDATIQPQTQEEAFGEALEPKTLHIIRNAGHFDPYYGEAFEESMAVQLKFLKTIFA